MVCLFNEIGKYCDLTVIYELRNASDRAKGWQEFKATNFKEIYLEGKQTSHEAIRCPDIKKHLTKDYDIIVLSGYSSPTMQIAIKHLHRKKIPFLMNTHGAFIPDKENFIKKWYKKSLISKASAYLTSGEVSKKQLVYYGANPDNVFFYPITTLYKSDIVDKKKADKKKLRKELGITEKKVIVSIGMFVPRKGMDVVLKAAQRFADQDIGFYLIGGEPTEEYLELSRGNKNIHFKNHIPKKDVLKYLTAADMFVFMTQEDIWGRVINEAFACGLPTITTDRCIAGLEMIENDKSGYILPVGDVEGLVSKIAEYINDDAKLKELGENALKTAQHYTFENAARRHIEVYKDFLSSKK